MAHSWHHAQSSARKYGGKAEDYIAIHTWFDATKSHLALPGHRALRHHTLGIFECEERFGVTLRNSAGRDVPVRFIGEQHVLEDCRRIPTVSDWLRQLPIDAWMVNGVILPDTEPQTGDPIDEWRSAVAANQTILGFKDWCERRDHQAKS
jgi:hypothetical protein